MENPVTRVHSENEVHIPKVNFSHSILNTQKEIILVVGESELANISENVATFQSFLTEDVVAELKKSNFTFVRNPSEGVSKLFIFSSKNSQTRAHGYQAAEKHFGQLKSNLQDLENWSINISSSFTECFACEYLYGIFHSSFNFSLKSRLPSDKEEKRVSVINVFFRWTSSLEQRVQKLETLARADQLTRLLYNTRADVANPSYMLGVAQSIVNKNSKNCELSFLKGEELAQKGLNLMYAVGKGSRNEPYLVTLHYKGDPENPSNTLAIVGKGVCYDSGGLSIKTSLTEIMHCDKGGACTSLGIFQGVVELGLKINLAVTLGLVENMPDGNAYRVSDIITSLKGYTVEILNTDAEGRLVLADAMTWTQWKYKPHTLLDFATLTGACMVALGLKTSAYYSNDDKLATDIYEAKTHEDLWRMPLTEEARENIVSEQADLRNLGKAPYGGSITAAVFLEKFVEEGVQWSHFDIAGSCARKGEGNLTRNTIEFLAKRYTQ